MRLIDADAVTYEHITLPGDDEVVEVITRDDVAALPTVCCEECAAFWGRRPCLTFDYAIADPRRFGCALFERRQP